MNKYILVFFFLILNINIIHANEKIVFIDINYIFNNSEAGKDLKKKMSIKSDNLQTEIEQFKNEIETNRKQILSQKNVLSAEEYNKKVSDLDQKVNKINSIISSKRKELKIYKDKIENVFTKNLNIMIEEFSNENSIDIILKKEDLLMAKKDLDITQTIFELFNKRISKIKIE